MKYLESKVSLLLALGLVLLCLFGRLFFLLNESLHELNFFNEKGPGDSTLSLLPNQLTCPSLQSESACLRKRGSRFSRKWAVS